MNYCQKSLSHPNCNILLLDPKYLSALQTLQSNNKSSNQYLSNDVCYNAYSKCIKTCESQTNYFDYNSSEIKKLSNTDYSSQCSSACRRGKSFCEGEDKDEMCYEFKRACSMACPLSIFDYSLSEFVLLSDFELKCGDACSNGQRACE